MGLSPAAAVTERAGASPTPPTRKRLLAEVLSLQQRRRTDAGLDDASGARAHPPLLEPLLRSDLVRLQSRQRFHRVAQAGIMRAHGQACGQRLGRRGRTGERQHV